MRESHLAGKGRRSSRAGWSRKLGQDKEQIETGRFRLKQMSEAVLYQLASPMVLGNKKNNTSCYGHDQYGRRTPPRLAETCDKLR